MFRGNEQKQTDLRVLVCGDRAWDDLELIVQKLMEIGPGNIALVIDGAARGADSLGNEAALQLKLKRLRFRADWQGHGKAAGPVRNKRMLVEGKPDLVLAFHDDLLASKGTKNMIEQARKAGVEVRAYSHLVEAQHAMDKVIEAFRYLKNEQRIRLRDILMELYCDACGMTLTGARCHCQNEE